MTRTELSEAITDLRHRAASLESVATNCTRCMSYQLHSVCTKHGPIPADFVQQGCDEWYFDEVPF